MPGRTFPDSSAKYPYSFNGKRDDNEAETSWQDYGMREYDRRRAQFISVDPLTGKYPQLTPYQFASNSPIGGTDADGLEFLSSQASAQKAKFEGEVALGNTYRGPVFKKADPSQKSFTQSWRDSKNFFIKLTYHAANGLYTFPQQLTSDARGAEFIYNIGGNAYHARGLQDENERLKNFADFAGTVVPGAPAEAKAGSALGKLVNNVIIKTENEVTQHAASLTSAEEQLVNEASNILNSKEFDVIRSAAKQGTSAKVEIGGRLIEYHPEWTYSEGMTLHEENGFMLGPKAFASEKETGKSLIHELFRLTNQSTGELGVDLTRPYTDDAYNAAEKLSPHLESKK